MDDQRPNGTGVEPDDVDVDVEELRGERDALAARVAVLDVLPKRGRLLTAPLAGAVEDIVGDRIDRFLVSDRFELLWMVVNAALEDPGSGSSELPCREIDLPELSADAPDSAIRRLDVSFLGLMALGVLAVLGGVVLSRIPAPIDAG